MNRMQEFTRIIGEVDMLYHEVSFRLGLSDSEMTVLYILLSDEKDCDISFICKMSGMKKQTINSALRKLEKDGYIQTTIYSHKNRSVCLTEKGKEYAKSTAGILMKIEEEAFEKWTQEEIVQYLSLSMRFLQDFRKSSEKKLNGDNRL